MTSPALSPWQARQAAMLYRYTSLEYLQDFHLVLSQIVEGSVDPVLAAPAKHGFHNNLQTAQWGKHDAYKNSHPCPFNIFGGLHDGLARDITERKKGVYRPTRRDEELRKIEQFWWQSLTPEEEHQYKLQVALINFLAAPIDSLLRAPASGWDDHDFAKHFPSFRIDSPQIPRFRIRLDISVESARQAPRTGVYVPADDPYGLLQFAVANNESYGLKNAITFNSMGLDALSTIGRSDLWFNDRKMLDFAANCNLLSKFRCWADRDGSFPPSVGRLAIAESAFEARSTRWHFVEVIPDEFEDVDFAPLAIPELEVPAMRQAGDRCGVAGYYFSTSRVGSNRFFSAGDTFPTLDETGKRTAWQWDVGHYPYHNT
jgi:hypothetical protein